MRIGVRHGDALRDAGRPLEAARAYLAVLPLAEGDAAKDLRVQAAKQLAFGGQEFAAVPLFDEALAEYGLSIPPPLAPGEEDENLAEQLDQLERRGFDFMPRREEEVPREELRKVDSLWAVGVGLHRYTHRSAGFRIRVAVAALDVGEPRRVFRILSNVRMLYGFEGKAEPAALLASTERSGSLAGADQSPFDMSYLDAMLHLIAGEPVLEEFEELERRLRGLSRLEIRELVIVRVSLAIVMIGRGRFGPARARMSEWAADARRRGDAGFLKTAAPVESRLRLACDDVSAARRILDVSVETWGYGTNNRDLMEAPLRIALYASDPEAALSAANALPGGGGVRGMVHRVFRSRALLLAVDAGFAQASRLDEVAAHVREVAGSNLDNVLYFAPPLQAGIAMLRGKREEALSLLDETLRLTAGRDDDTQLQQCIRRRKGVLLGGPEGRALVEQADAELSAFGIVNPERWAAMTVPGFGALPKV